MTFVESKFVPFLFGLLVGSVLTTFYGRNGVEKAPEFVSSFLRTERDLMDLPYGYYFLTDESDEIVEQRHPGAIARSWKLPFVEEEKTVSRSFSSMVLEACSSYTAFFLSARPLTLHMHCLCLYGSFTSCKPHPKTRPK